MTIRTLSIALLTLAVLSGCASSGGLNRQAPVSEAKLSQARAMVNSQRQYNEVVYKLSAGARACAEGAPQYRAPFSLLFNNKAIKDQELRNALYAVLGAEDQPVLQAHTAAMRPYDGAQVVSINGTQITDQFKALRAEMDAVGGNATIHLVLADGRAVDTQPLKACNSLVISDSTSTIKEALFTGGPIELTPISWTQLAGSEDEQAFILARSVYFTSGEGSGKLRTALYAGAAVNGVLRGLTFGLSGFIGDAKTGAVRTRRGANQSDADVFALRLMKDAGYKPGAALDFARRSQSEGNAWPADCDELKFDASRIGKLQQAL
jgi:hypothetical protein